MRVGHTLAGLAMVLVGCGGPGTLPCGPNDVALALHLGARGSTADALRIRIDRAGGSQTTTHTWTPGRSDDTLTIALDSARAGDRLDLSIDALAAGVVVASGSTSSPPLDERCVTLGVAPVDVPGPQVAQVLEFDLPYTSIPLSTKPSLLPVDVDGDGDVDLITKVGFATGGDLSNDVEILRNEGGKLVPASLGLSTLPALRLEGLLEDLDGDGQTDAYRVDFAGQTLSVHKRIPGGFAAAATYALPAYPQRPALADVDGDGDLDFVIPASNPSGLLVMRNDGDGAFAAPEVYGAGAEPWCVAMLDLDGDGKLDAVVGNHPSDEALYTLRNHGDGTFEAAVRLPLTKGATQLFTTDLDGDGSGDLVIDRGGYGFATALNPHGGTLTPSQIVAWSQYHLVVGDVDSDGHPDLAVLAPSGLVLFGNDGAGVLSERSSWAGNAWGEVALADIDGDGHIELVTASNVEVSVLRDHGMGRYDSPRSLLSTGIAAAGGDLDGDGKLDLVLANDTVSVLRGLGDGTFAGGELVDTLAIPLAVVLLDVDGDGKLDLIVGGETNDVVPERARVAVALGRGDGTFAPSVVYPAGAGFLAMAAGDLDGDGRPEIVVSSGASLTLFHNDGADGFTTMRPQLVGDYFRYLGIGDVDADGASDVVGVSAVRVALIRNAGNGTLGSITTLAGDLDTLHPGLAVDDLDGDGYAEVAFLQRGPNANDLLVRDGRTGAINRHAVDPMFPVGSLAHGDLDGDGRADLIVDGRIIVRRSASGDPISLDLAHSWWSVVGDIDGDGRKDLVNATMVVMRRSL
jgi:hypothetical protein